MGARIPYPPATQGPAGSQGPKGDTGLQGPVGAAGADGATGAQGPKGDTGAQGAKGDTGATGPAGLGTITPSTPSRSLNTTFQPSATKAVLTSYSIQLSVTNPLLVGTSSAQVQLLSDSSNPPTTVRATAGISSGVGITVTLALTTGNTIPVTYIVPAGHYVRLVSTTTGTGSASIAAQAEEALG